MDEYIKREDALDAVLFALVGTGYQSRAIYAISDIATTDAVEVVRCKDCKYFGREIAHGKHDCKKYEMPYCLENDFCSYGERKE